MADLVLKQAVAVIDKKTTIVCLHVAGQIRAVDEPFDTLNGQYQTPGFHIHCRTISAPWMPGFVNEQRETSNAELLRRPLKQRRLGPDGEIGARLPPGPLGDPGVPVGKIPPPPASTYLHARRTDLSEWDAAELDDTELLRAHLLAGGRGDHQIVKMWKDQGFDGAPTVGTAADLEQLISKGGWDLFRGIEGDNAEALIDQFRNGTGSYGGLGIYGNGTYFAVVKGKGAVDALEVAKKYSGGVGIGGVGSAGNKGAVFRAVLRPDAKVIDIEDLLAEMNAQAASPAGLPSVFREPGKYATARGYDAIYSGAPDYHLALLNRTAVMVERTNS